MRKIREILRNGRSYVGDYLKEEIMAEGLVRNLPHFSDFLRFAALNDTEIVNYSTIARDVAADWQRGRCYLPVEWTQGLSPTISREPEGGAVQSGVRELLAAADGYYAAGESGIAALESGSRLAVRAASKIYHAIGTQIRKRQCLVLDGRARVSLMGKVGYFGTAVLAGFLKNERLPPAADAARALAVSEKLLFDHGVLS